MVVGAGANVYRARTWLMHDYVRFEGFLSVERHAGTRDEPRRWAGTCAKVRIPVTIWRPVTVTLPLCAPPDRGARHPLRVAGRGRPDVHRVWWARSALLLYVAVMSVTLMSLSIARYFGGDWSAFRMSLP